MNGLDMDDGVPDMTVISDINEHGINKNLQKRYKRNKIYVSIIIIWFLNWKFTLLLYYYVLLTFPKFIKT